MSEFSVSLAKLAEEANLTVAYTPCELEKIKVIQGMLAKGFDWQTIQDITQLDQAGYEALQAKHPR